jgi:hypothetical protein
MARRLKVPVARLREEAEAGRVPHVKIGDRMLFNPDAVLRTLAGRAESEGLRTEPAHA